MSTDASPNSALLDGAASRLLEEFAISQAAELARKGAYDRAESMLRPSVERPDAPVAGLDLQARIFAQQGRLSEAEVLWRRALVKAPDNAACLAALARIHRERL